VGLQTNSFSICFQL